tara:strand:+ start:3767 stop:4687 length:921 start_codon:yes stop_codon:yes gene_type:complete
MLANFKQPTNGEPDELYLVTSDGKIKAKRSTSSSSEKRILNVEADRRSSAMPGAPKNKEFAGGKRDIATQFSDSYSRAGIRPLSIEEQTSQQEFPTQQDLVPASKSTRPHRKKKRKVIVPTVTPVQIGVAALRNKKIRATAVNMWLWAWGLWLWLLIQIPFVLFSLVFMALTQVIYMLFNDPTNTTGGDESTGFWATIGGYLVQGVGTLLEGIVSLVDTLIGIDLTIFSPGGFFLMTHTIVAFIGFGTLLLCYIQYKIAFIRPLTGGGASIKSMALLIAIIGYSIPILNIFPWFMLWTVAVWAYPK